jgi:hypothetical protein
MTVPADFEYAEDISPVEDITAPSWKPEGSMFSPEIFREQLHQYRGQQPQLVDPASTSESAILFATQDGSPLYEDIENLTAVSVSIDPMDSLPDDELVSSTTAMVPTIMLSNSTAALPLPLESSLSIAPLAARRGHKGPTPLKLSMATTATMESQSLYPGIPTPFLGSPSAYSPKFEFSENPTDFSMDLATMCQDLRSRCPPLHPPSPPSKELISSVQSLSDSGSSSSDQDPNSDSDDWAFAKDILAQLEDTVPPDFLAAKPETHTDDGDSYSWSSAPTLTNSPRSENNYMLGTSEDVFKRNLTPLRRRRTVIIESPQDSTMGTRPARLTVDLSQLADETPVSGSFDEPLPMEVSEMPNLDVFAESTPHLRPMSNVSTFRMPIRSILKTREKKKVRFSLSPGMEGDNTEGNSIGLGDNQTEGQKMRGRAATVPMYRPGSPFTRVGSKKFQAKEQSTSRASSPKHPEVRIFTRRATLDVTSPTPASRKPYQSLQLLPRTIDKSEVSAPQKLGSHIARQSVPAVIDSKKKIAKKGLKNENAGRRFSEGGKRLSIASSPMKSRMPFRSILTKLRA